MSGTVKKLRFSEGTDVGAPTDLSLATSTSVLEAFVDDAAYAVAEGAPMDGSTYVNTTEKTLTTYVSTAWRRMLPKNDISDATKLVDFDFSGQATGRKTTIAVSSSSTDKTFTIPNKTGTAAVYVGNDLDVPAAGASSFAANAGANNVTVGGASSTVVIPGNLQVQGTTTQVDTTNMNVKDANVLLNDGGNDASSEGAGWTVERTGTSGSVIYGAAYASRWAVGDLGSEAEMVTVSHTQIITNKDIDGGTASNSRRITIPSDTIANLTALTRKAGTIVYATDTQFFYKDNGVSLTPIPNSTTASIGANIRASEGAGTTTLVAADERFQTFDLTADRTVKLPSTGILQGEIFVITNPNPYKATIQADDATNIVKSWGAEAWIVALTNAPATNSDWKVIEHSVLYGRSRVTYSPTLSGSTTTSLLNVGWDRPSIGVMHIHGFITFASGSGTNAFSVSFPAPGGSALTFDTFIQGQGENLGPCTFNFQGTSPAGTLFGGFVTVSGAGTATDITFYTGQGTAADATIGGNSGVVPLLENQLNTSGSYLSFDANIPITEWSET
jgi:hypothetical protein